MARFFHTLKTLHSWLGFFILPWLVLYGFTGFYLNHSKSINQFLASTPYDESQFPIRPEAEWLSIYEARQKAHQVWPNETIKNTKAVKYHGFVALEFSKPSGKVIIAIKSGHFYKKTRLYRFTYDISGTLVDRKFYWSYLFHYFHEVGWIDKSFGIWFADITAISLILFGFSGLFLFILPRKTKLKRFLFRHRR